MIETPEQLYQAIDEMGRMQRILESHRNFAMLAEGPLEQLRQPRAQIDEYVRRLEGTTA